WIDGLNTAQLVDRLGRMTVADACQIAFQAALGLQSLHNQDLIHRDVKPSNLMLSAGGTVRLLDLGLARMGESHQVSSILTPAGSLLGSLDFMAPEQADDPSNVGPPADIYSLGACLYHFLSGRSVLGLDESAGYLEKIAKLSLTGPARLSTKNQQIPRQLAELVDGMLVPAVSNRNVDLDAICQVLQRFAEESDLPQLLHRARNPSPSTGGVDLSSNPNPGAEPDQGSRETRDFPQFHSTPEHVPDETPDERTNDWIDRVRSAIKRFRSQNR
ncbi:MAG: serine/threonine-protein kinase, partial [Planctomycetota bacterium]